MKNNKIYPITPSDWITYLHGETTIDLNYMLAAIAAIFFIILSLMQMSIITGDISLFSKYGIPSMLTLGIQLTVVLIIILIITIILIKPHSKLIKKIIKGELTTHEEILVEYKRIEFDIKKSWKEFKHRKYLKSNKKFGNLKIKKDESIWEDDSAFVKNKK